MRNKKLEALVHVVEAEKEGWYTEVHAKLGWVYTKAHAESAMKYMEYQEYRFEKIFESIPYSKKPLRILDIGTTPFTFFLKETYPYYEIATLDLTSLWEDICGKRGIIFRQHDLSKQPAPFDTNYFDIVIFSETMEHLFARPSDVLREMYRILAGGGKLIFTGPNMAVLSNRVKLLFGVNLMSSFDEAIQMGTKSTMYGHLREYTMRECVLMLKRLDFKIECKTFIHPRIRGSLATLGNKWFLLPIVVMYRLTCLLVPPFRGVIYIEGIKQVQDVE